MLLKKQNKLSNDYPIDPWIVLTTSLLIIIGFLMITSASYPNLMIRSKELSGFAYTIKQAKFAILGLIVAIIMFMIPSKVIEKITLKLVFAVIFLLVLVLIPGIGKKVNGAMRWIYIGGVNIQPSELAKFATIIYGANYLNRHLYSLKNNFYVFFAPLVVIGVMGGLLLLQPDFGSFVVIILVLMGMLFIGGVSLFRFSSFVLLALTTFTVLISTSNYRRDRLFAFFDPWSDPLNKGFQLIQSLIAISRGHFYGQGIGESVQKLGYLPEAHTDFIFAIYAEETGFIGVTFLILTFLILFWRCFYIGYRAYKNLHLFQAFCAYGIGLLFIIQSLINIGVVTGSLPTKGLTLPFISYGGSSLVIMMMLIGFLLRLEKDTRTLNHNFLMHAPAPIRKDHPKNKRKGLPTKAFHSKEKTEPAL